MKYCADNYPPGMTGLPPEDKPVGKCIYCKCDLYAGEGYDDHGDLICDIHIERHTKELYSRDERIQIIVREAGIKRRIAI